jgi:hypothetical protein
VLLELAKDWSTFVVVVKGSAPQSVYPETVWLYECKESLDVTECRICSRYNLVTPSGTRNVHVSKVTTLFCRKLCLVYWRSVLFWEDTTCAGTQGAVWLLRRGHVDQIPVQTLGTVDFGKVLCRFGRPCRKSCTNERNVRIICFVSGQKCGRCVPPEPDYEGVVVIREIGTGYPKDTAVLMHEVRLQGSL